MGSDDTTSDHPLEPTREHAGLGDGAAHRRSHGPSRAHRWLLVTVVGGIALAVAVLVVVVFDGDADEERGPKPSSSTSTTSPSVASTTTSSTVSATPTTSVNPPPIEITVPTLVSPEP